MKVYDTFSSKATCSLQRLQQKGKTPNEIFRDTGIEPIVFKLYKNIKYEIDFKKIKHTKHI